MNNIPPSVVVQLHYDVKRVSGPLISCLGAVHVGDLQLGLRVDDIEELLEDRRIGALEKRVDVEGVVTINVVLSIDELILGDTVEYTAMNGVEMSLHHLVVLDTTTLDICKILAF